MDQVLPQRQVLPGKHRDHQEDGGPRSSWSAARARSLRGRCRASCSKRSPSIELAEDFLRDYRINQKKSLVRAERSVNHLKRFFEGMQGHWIATTGFNSMSKCGLARGRANATINRELSALKRMLNLGAQQTPPIVDRVPHIPMLRENNVRKGFFEHGDFIKLREALPEHLRGFITFAYKTGWRLGEITELTWDKVDLKHGVVRLDPGDAKNNEPRSVVVDAEVLEVLNRQWKTQGKVGSDSALRISE